MRRCMQRLTAVAASAAVAAATTFAGAGCTVMASKHRGEGALADGLIVAGMATAAVGGLGEPCSRRDAASGCMESGEGAQLALAAVGLTMIVAGLMVGGRSMRDE